jgi:DNA-binding PadR family transcriptional regulator
MASKHAVLALVIERPDYGYDLAKRLDERCGPWAWSRQAVYKALEELAEDKHVRTREHVRARGEARATGRNQRTVYEATPGGIDYFDSWMFDPAAMETSRPELELKIVLARSHELPTLIEMTWAHEQQCVDRLAALAREAQGAESGGALSWADVAEKLVRDTEIKRLRLRVECLQEARRTMQLFLDRTAEPSSRWPRRAG